MTIRTDHPHMCSMASETTCDSYGRPYAYSVIVACGTCGVVFESDRPEDERTAGEAALDHMSANGIDIDAPSGPERLVRTYQQRLLAIRAAAGNATARAWTLANVDDVSAARFVAQAATVSVAAQTRTSALVDAYLAAMLARPPKGIEAPVGPAVRNGTEPDDVYHRAIVEARVKLSEGQTWADAMRAGRARAVSSAETDVMLTERQAFVDWSEGEKRIVGYRRVLTGRSCMFCATASTQRYKTGTLRPIHSHCDCVSAPIVGSIDPGHVMNRELLSALKAQGGSQYWKARGLVEIDGDDFLVSNPDGTARVLKVTEKQHGELGPVLVDRDQHFASLAA